jgi:hypothetical protein
MTVRATFMARAMSSAGMAGTGFVEIGHAPATDMPAEAPAVSTGASRHKSWYKR